MVERRQNSNLSNDLLLQILEHQELNARTLGNIEGNVAALAGPVGRVTQLENASTRNLWVTYVVTPILFIATATARHFGVKI